MGQGERAAEDDMGPQPEFDELMSDLGERAQDRWHGFVRAHRAVSGNLSLEGVLTRMVEAACDLVDASYGAIGVIGSDGRRFDRFIHVGVDSEQAGRIGHLPEGLGLLGALIDDPRPIRLRDLRTDPRSAGFPDAHPAMRGFIGVPIRVRDEVFGNLYLASPTTGEFDADDEQLVLGLAATAGVAIENARLYEEARKRELWLEASTHMTRLVLTSPSEQALQAVAGRVEELAEADVVAVALPVPDTSQLRVLVAAGSAAGGLVGFTYALAGTISERVMATAEPEVFEDVRTLGPDSPVLQVAQVVGLGPAMVVPLSGLEGVRGVLVVGRRPGRHAFEPSEVDMSTNFASHASIALELADARREAQRLDMFEDRARIARDLHDHVIQQLFAAGMSLQASLPRVGDGAAGASIDRVVDIIDDAIRQIRASVFQLRPRTPLGGTSLRTAVLEVVAQAGATLGWDVPVDFVGAVESVSDDALVDDVVAVVRESLSNVARHAGARHADVSVTVSGPLLEVAVEDDGIGLGEAARRSGLANLRHRAESRSGTFEIGPNDDDRGTRVTWTVPFAAVRPTR
jgi:signal transduction histidine kinase